MIKWHLNRVMAEKRLSGRWLADKLGVHPNTIYRLRRTDTMPNLDGERLSKICYLLGCQPGDLLEYLPNGDPAWQTKA